MQLLTTTLRISISLVCLLVSLLFAAQLLGLVPNETKALLRARRSLCETIAIDCSLAAARNDLKLMEESLKAIVQRTADLNEASGVTPNDRVLIHVGAAEESSTAEAEGEVVLVPLAANKQPWGTIKLRFEPLTKSAGWNPLNDPFMRLIIFVSAAGCLTCWLYLRRVLKHLVPSKVVPDRVRMTLDTLAEGLFVIDKNERIVLANQAFAKTLGMSSQELQGRDASVLPWYQDSDKPAAEGSFPWSRSIREGRLQTGDVMQVKTGADNPRTFKVNAAPIFDDQGNCQGALTSLDDVTTLEERNAQLTEMLERLQESRDKIREQNKELEILATRDPLTSVLNRRSFFEFFEKQWHSAQRYRHPLSCVMVDVDHFKSINDKHGHSVGDEVLQGVSGVLRGVVRQSDILCRYGGEEFCVLLPHLALEEAAQAAERFRYAIESTTIHELSVTASLGVSGFELGAETPQELLDQADKCLYAAKRGGRNRVARWDEVCHDPIVESAEVSREARTEEPDARQAIPFQSVTALISALAFRDADTAEHSRRVADLCVAVAHRLMSLSEAYILENAALLHDIGKIGVPDSILLKPGPLTEHEWKVMRTHDRIGVEIIISTFACNELTDIVQAHHFPFAGNPSQPEQPTGHAIPLGGRILTIADAFDAMVSDRVYRKGRSREEAMAELRRCAGRQFDPELVERFIEVVQERDESRLEGASAVSKRAALGIGVQIERLVQALDNRDIQGLEALAGRLKATATKSGISNIAEVAAHLEQCLAGDVDWVKALSVTIELLELCRATQRSYITREVNSEALANHADAQEVNA